MKILNSPEIENRIELTPSVQYLLCDRLSDNINNRNRVFLTIQMEHWMKVANICNRVKDILVKPF
jgi:hypothetical protein